MSLSFMSAAFPQMGKTKQTCIQRKQAHEPTMNPHASSSTRGAINGVSDRQAPVFGNRLLDSLSRPEIEWIAPGIRRVFLHRDQALAEAGEPLAYLYFPVDALVWSWAETTGTERPTSIATCGQRGVVGIGRALSVPNSDFCVSVISPGTAWRLPYEALESNLANGRSDLRRLLNRYAYMAMINGACRLACNSEHNIDQRLARWLLWVSDETGKPEVTITHQQLADVAAIRRPSVSLALSAFQRENIVRSQHGRLQILARERLEQNVCACYWEIRKNAEGVYDSSKREA